MSNRASAIIIVVVLGLVGFNLAELEILVTNYFLGTNLPTTQWFRLVFWLWVVTALASAWLGIYGGYLAIRSNDISNRYLKTFLLILCFMIKVDGKELGWSSFRLSLFLGVEHFAVGVNFVGVAIYWWYAKVRELTSRPLRPLESSDTSGRAV